MLFIQTFFLLDQPGRDLEAGQVSAHRDGARGDLPSRGMQECHCRRIRLDVNAGDEVVRRVGRDQHLPGRQPRQRSLKQLTGDLPPPVVWIDAKGRDPRAVFFQTLQVERHLAGDGEEKTHQLTVRFCHQQPLRVKVEIQQYARAKDRLVDRVMGHGPVPQPHKGGLVLALVGADADRVSVIHRAAPSARPA